VARAEHQELGVFYLHAEPQADLLFCENETNTARTFGSEPATCFPKDGIGDHLLYGADTVNPAGEGTKVAAAVRLSVPAGGQAAVLVRLTREGPETLTAPFDGASELIAGRRAEADDFYEAITPPSVTDDAKAVMRQALAGMLWSKQCYYFDVDRWLRELHLHPLRSPAWRGSRNESWFHMFNHDVVSMPDKWEYPWYAAWDLAFHCIPLAMVDPDFAKSQIDLMLSQDYLHPNGQMPAYEWNFGDVNPPVHAFATLFLQNLESDLGEVDLPFLQEGFARLLLNFTWWVNRKDPSGRNAFEGGFLGLDNIGVFDRSAALPTGGRLEQADGTAWMAMFSQNMLEMSLALLEHDPSYEQFTLKFVEHFFWIAAAVDPIGEHPDEMWDEEDGFFYDVLRLPDGTRHPDQGSLPGRPAAPVRHDGDRGGHAPPLPGDRREGAGLPGAQPGPPGQHRRPARARRPRPAAAVPGERRQAAAHSGPDAGRGAFPGPARDPLDLPVAPRASLQLQRRRGRASGAIRAGRVDQRDVRWQLQLAGAGLVPDQPAPDPGPAPALPLLRQ
jgi:hypothetical protein